MIKGPYVRNAVDQKSPARVEEITHEIHLAQHGQQAPADPAGGRPFLELKTAARMDAVHVLSVPMPVA
jgi:hypothetical protein